MCDKELIRYLVYKYLFWLCIVDRLCVREV